MDGPLKKVPKFSQRTLRILAALLVVGLLAACAGFFLLSRNLTPLVRWTFETSLPDSKIAVQDVQLTAPGVITFTNFVINDPLTGKELARLERGKIVFSLDDLAAGRIGEIHLENPSVLISPGWSGILPAIPEKSGGLPLRIRRIVCDFGEMTYEGKANVRANFCFDWRDFAKDSTEPLMLTLWDIQASAAGYAEPFLVLDLVRLIGAPAEMVKNFELRSLDIKGGSIAAGGALDQLAHLPTERQGTGPAFMWKIGAVDIHGVKATAGDNPWRSKADAVFTINTTLRNLTPAEITSTLGGTIQQVEISDLVIPSPNDPFTRVVSLRSVFLKFTLAGLLSKELEDVTVLHPVIHIGEELFTYMEASKKRMAAGTDTPAPGWRIKRFDVKFGSVVIGSGGRTEYGLPLNFRTTAENVALDDLASLTLRGSLEIPAQEYGFPAYQIEINTEPGSLQFSYPPEKSMSNVVGTVRIKNLRWRQFRGSDSWITATFDRQGITGFFGGNLYKGTIAGGFSFFFGDKSPWVGWLSGTRVDLGQLTDIMAPHNFQMTGPLDFEGQVNAESRSIRRLKGHLETQAPGRITFGKIDQLLARIPTRWSPIKRDSLRIALEAMRDFDYYTGSGDFWFTDGQGIFDLKLQGPLGSRTFQTVLHDGESNTGTWSLTSPR